MSTDHTQRQSTEDQQHSRDLSLKRTRPPIEIPGYETRQFLGSGAYGEVWVAIDKNTGRRVAIKFYIHRGGLDWSLLSREVEKLVFLSADRYVVQLLDVGWDSDPPYYVMEYIENGSLDEHIQKSGALPVGEAVEIFRGVATGLLHAHGRGVLHCDLKPANILLDQDNQPRLADFGQSRLSHEQTPALGTLFYMAPEQADLKAVPDARWDVYALGALLYCMLTGDPPHRGDVAVSEIDTGSLEDRLARYRKSIEQAPLPQGHRQIRGIDRALSEIIDDCLVVNPDQRVPNVQSVLDGLAVRDRIRDQRPLLVLGLIGPLLFVLVMSLFGWRSYQRTLSESEALLIQGAVDSDRSVARFGSEAVSRRIERLFRAVEKQALDPEFIAAVENVLADEDAARLLDAFATSSEEVLLVAKVADIANSWNPIGLPGLFSYAITPDKDAFEKLPKRMALESILKGLISDSDDDLPVASWFVTNAKGYHLAAVFDSKSKSTLGINYSWRSYFNGEKDYQDRTRRAETHIVHTQLSEAFQSTATFTWKVAVSTPIYAANSGNGDKTFLGVVALTIELGRFSDLAGEDEKLVLVDGHEGEKRGVILQHPLFNELLRNQHREELPDFSEYRVPLDEFQQGVHENYVDPLGATADGSKYTGRWIAAIEDVRFEGKQNAHSRGNDNRLIVLTQKSYDEAAAPVKKLQRRLVWQGLMALGLFGVVVGSLWLSVLRVLRDPNEAVRRQGRPTVNPTPLHSMETMELPSRMRRS